MSRIPLIIDCDPGVDDAVMLMLALASSDLDIRAITTVAGNVPLHLTSRNARMMCDLMDRREVPVYAGCPRPMVRTPVTAEDFHGESGIAGLEPFEPETPLVSLVGEKMDPVLTSEQWQALKRRKSWDDYDYRKVFSAEGTNPTEKVGWPSESVKILKLE